MKKIINGRMYNTETAREIAKAGTRGELSFSDFRWYEETLFKKRTGEYFLHGEGGPMTSYCKHLSDGGRGWGESIQPLTVNQASRWAEENLSSEDYESIFGTGSE